MRVSFYSKHRITLHGTTQLRCNQPAKVLDQLGHSTSVNTIYLKKPKRRELIILHRAKYDRHTRLFMNYARALGCSIWYDLDDLLFSQDADRYLSHIGNKRKNFSAKEYAECIKRCDKVLVSTTFLKEQLDSLHNDVVVVKNFLSSEFITSAKKVKEVHADNRHFTLGYLSGSKSHNKDFEQLTPSLLEFLSAHNDVRLLIVGPLELSEAFAPFSKQIERRDFIPYDELPKVYSEIDLNLVPLERDESFCQAKSELKYIEAGACGVASIATATAPYSEAIEHGVNGFLVRDNEWAELFEAVYSNKSLLNENAQAAHIDVLENYTEQAAVHKWKDIIMSYNSSIPVDKSLRSSLFFKLEKLRWKRVIRRKVKDLGLK